MGELLKPNVYGYTRRGLTKRNLIPWSSQTEDGTKIANIVPHNDVTVAGQKLVSSKVGRSYFDFQNQSDTDMRINFAIPATAEIGIIVPAGASRIWDARSDIGVVADDVYVFCTLGNKAYAYSEAGA